MRFLANLRTRKGKAARTNAASTISTAAFPISDAARAAEARTIARYTSERDTPVKLDMPFDEAVRRLAQPRQATNASDESERGGG